MNERLARVACLVRSADFERVLRSRSRISSTHFAVHHLGERPTAPVPKRASELVSRLSGAELSTGASPPGSLPVDDWHRAQPNKVWLGAVVPKRHARRAVTRTLLKRQIRAVVAGQAGALAEGLWVIRLRAPFDRVQFASAASDILRQAAREELEGLLAGAVQRVARAV